MSKATPGPWELGPWIDSDGGHVYRIVYGVGRSVGSVAVYGKNRNAETAGRSYRDAYGIIRKAKTVTSEECDANAALIAAAPELRDALRACLAYFERGGDADVIEARARAALAKAGE